MTKTFLIGLFLYITGILVWVFTILIPYGTKILTHLQSVANDHINLDLIYCFKQFMFGFGWTILLGISLQLIMIFVVNKLFFKN
jgi:hypothetical protein